MRHQKDIECSIIDQSDRAEENKIEMKFNEKREEKKKGKTSFKTECNPVHELILKKLKAISRRL